MTERLTKREYDGSVGISALRYYNYDDFQKMAKKLAHYEDLEEKCKEETTYDFKTLLWKWKEFYEDIAQWLKWRDINEQGRLVVLPEELDKEKLLDIIADILCPRYVGLEDWGHDKEKCPSAGCNECWEMALKGGAEDVSRGNDGKA